MKNIFLAVALSASLFIAPTDSLDKTQLIGNRIPFVVEPQSQFLYSFAVDTVTGNYFLPWSQSNNRIYGRLFGPHGGKIAPAQSFQGGTVEGQPRSDSHALVVFNSIDRCYLVVWHSYFGDYIHGIVAYERRGQFVSSQGKTQGASWVLFQDDIDIYELLYNGKDNQYVLVYSMTPEKQSQRGFYLQRLDSGGQLLGPPLKLISQSGESNTAIDIAYDDRKNQYIAVWAPESSKPCLLRYRIISANLQMLGAVHLFENMTAMHSRPVVLYDQYKKRFVVLWNNGGELKVRGISSEGVPKTSVISLGNLNLFDYRFSAAFNSLTGSILIGYVAQGDWGPLLFLTRINPDFSHLGDPFFGSSQFDGRVGSPILRFSPPANEYMLIWSYLDIFPNSRDIYGQRVRGTPLSSTPLR